ncbi:LOW QUALITY PROTEIN: ciliary microtubule inner protein 6 [Leptodactylus fuscus]
MPHPYHAKFIRDNVRFLNEPITYMLTSNTKHRQTEWWPRYEENVYLHKPSYNLMTTQRSDFRHQTYSSPQTRHGCNPHKSPLHGIVPLASPRGRNRLPKLLQEEISFLHQYDSRLTPNEPIRGKRHGAFVWKEIKTESGSAVPHGTKLFLNATGSHALNIQTERGNSVESSMTSPSICLHGSQQMFTAQAHLSKTEFREAAKADPEITAALQNYVGCSQAFRRKSLFFIGEAL